MLKNNRFSKQIVMLVSAFLVAVIGVLAVLLISQSKNLLQKHMRERMLDIAKSAAALLDGDDLEKLQKEDEGTEPYQKALGILRSFQEQVELRYIYGIRDMGGKKFTFTIDPTVEDPGEFGEPVAYTDALYQASLGTPSVDKEPYEDNWGRFYSAYSPVLNSDGKVAGIVAVDIDANWYEDQLRGNVYTTAVVCLISLLAGAAIVLFVIAKVRKRFFSISEEMSRLGEDVESLAGELRLASGAGRYNERMLDFKPKYNDEFELLESKLHFIRDELKQYINDAREMAYTDALTGLGNRTAYFEEINRIDAQIVSGRANFSVAVFDINGLKSANDNLGHEFGDLLIRTIAGILKECVAEGKLYRIGGDEFVAIAQNSGKDFFEKTFALIDRALSDRGGLLRNGEKQSPLSVSKGAAVYEKGVDKQFNSVFHKADRLMYDDKAAWHSRNENV